MCESLDNLKKYVNLYLFHGDVSTILTSIIKDLKLKTNSIIISWNHDYSLYSKSRDNNMKDLLDKLKIDYHICYTDYTLHPMLSKPYKQYGAYYKNVVNIKVSLPDKTVISNFADKIIFKDQFKDDLSVFYKRNDNLAQKGGRDYCIDIIENKFKNFKDYAEKRDMLSYNTTRISGGLNFGCVSVREVYHCFQGNKDFQKQLYWRDFWLQALALIPNADKFSHIDDRFNKISWKNDKETKRMWKMMIESRTGILLVDAGMSEMINTGYCHNRCRMILGMFWTKYLHINPFNPEYGSQTGFSRYLLDAVGPSQNKMNHHWITEFDFPGRRYGCSLLAGRPMDVSNSVIKKFDPDCEYIKKWIPELKDVPKQDIYRWDNDMYNKHKKHVPPKIDLDKQFKIWCEMTKN